MMYKGLYIHTGVLFLLICFGFFRYSISYTVSDRKKLHDYLFDAARCNKLFRPQNIDGTVTIEAKYKLQYVISVDIKRQIISTTGLFSLFWKDSLLVWNKATYGDIEYIYVPEDLVWHPDLIVLNSIIELENKLGAGRIIRISNEGQLRWEPIAVLSTACSMVLAWFPFDSQTCFIKLASMDHPFYEVNLISKSNAVDTDLHETQADWELVDTLQTYSYLLDDGGVAYPVVEFGIIVKRLPLHYILIVIVPTILTAVLTFIAFFLPLKSGTRLGYIVTVVLALVVLLTLFADTIPSAAKFPSILVAVFTVTLGMAFLLIIITIFVMRIYNKPKRDVNPKWMHSMVRKIRQLKSKLLLKCKCRASRIDHLKQNQPVEDGRPTEETNRVENSTQLKPYSNQELAEFFDNFLFVIFTVLYILILSSAPVVAAIWVENYKSN